MESTTGAKPKKEQSREEQRRRLRPTNQLEDTGQSQGRPAPEISQKSQPRSAVAAPGVPAAYGECRPGPAGHAERFIIGETARAIRVFQSTVTTPNNGHTNQVGQGLFMILADGFEGQRHGLVAADVAAQSVSNYVLGQMPWAYTQSDADAVSIDKCLRYAVEQAQEHLRTVSSAQKLGSIPHCALTVAYLTWPRIHVASVGGAACYLSRRGELIALAGKSAPSSRGGLASGGESGEVAKGAGDGHADSEPESSRMLGGAERSVDIVSRHFTYAPGDRIVLLSDGLSSNLDDTRLKSCLAAAHSDHAPPNVQQSVQAAVGLLLNEGSRDKPDESLTAIVMQL